MCALGWVSAGGPGLFLFFEARSHVFTKKPQSPFLKLSICRGRAQRFVWR